jgi:hypothetical protein
VNVRAVDHCHLEQGVRRVLVRLGRDTLRSSCNSVAGLVINCSWMEELGGSEGGFRAYGC